MSVTRALKTEKSFTAEAKKIRELHEDVMKHARDALKDAIEIGGLLVKVKGKLKHGQWLPWIEANVPFTEASAVNYMRCYENRAKLKNVLSLSDAYRLLAGTGQRPKSREPREQASDQTQPDDCDAASGEPQEPEPEQKGKTLNGEDADKVFDPEKLKPLLLKPINRLLKHIDRKREQAAKRAVVDDWFSIHHGLKDELMAPVKVIYADGTEFDIDEVLRSRARLRLKSDPKREPLKPVTSIDITAAVGHAPHKKGGAE